MKSVDIIAKKRDGGEFDPDELTFFVNGVVEGSIPDYQTSAWLMAIYLRGMTPRETRDLTLAMRDSGKRIDLSDLPGGPFLDKHSTGGVGDKTTLVVVPLLAAAGVSILKLSGRGLGFSGGTIDKLEAIPGFRTNLTLAEAKSQVARIGAALIAQSGDLAPADKILYALRDVTATVESIPLIASSIMSKKLAAGADRIVLDVKVGQGAFMKSRERAILLARELVAIGDGAGVPTSAVLTAMDEPLGFAVGNALEVAEACSVLGREGLHDPRFETLCLELALQGLLAAEKAGTREEATRMAADTLHSGRAGVKFAEIVAAQGGYGANCREIRLALPTAKQTHVLKAERSGMVAGIDAEEVGRLSVEMGAGRTKKEDTIAPAVGILLHKKTGDEIKPGDSLATLYLRESDTSRAEAFAGLLHAAYRFAPASNSVAALPSLVLETVFSSRLP